MSRYADDLADYCEAGNAAYAARRIADHPSPIDAWRDVRDELQARGLSACALELADDLIARLAESQG